MPKVHLDTDIGGDIDDLCALALLLNWPDVDLIAVTSNSDDRGKRAGAARYVLDLAGRNDVPVAAGADAAGGYYRVWPGLPDEARYWPTPLTPVETPVGQALDLLEQSIEQGALILAIGAYTNLALLEERSPGILRRARLFLMGGYLFPPRTGFPAWGNEFDWNVQVDVRSAYTALQAADHPTLIPLSVTVETVLRRADLPQLRAAGPLAQLIAHQAEPFAEDEGIEAKWGQTCAALPDDTINFQHDPLACAIALGWREGVEIRQFPLHVAIKAGWLVESIAERGQPAHVVTQIDGPKFSEFWLDMVCR